MALHSPAALQAMDFNTEESWSLVKPAQGYSYGAALTFAIDSLPHTSLGLIFFPSEVDHLSGKLNRKHFFFHLTLLVLCQ